MTRRESGAASATARRTALAVACVAAWTAAAASAVALGIWPAIGSTALALGVAVFAFDRAAATSSLRPSPLLVLIGAASGAAMVAGTHLFYPLLAGLVPVMADDTARLYASFHAVPPAVVWLALGPIVVSEDLVWRGVVQTELVQRVGRWGGVALAAVLYALAHAPAGSLALVLAALACGLCWGALRAASGSLVPTLVAHLVWDVAVLLVRPLNA